MRKPLKIWFTDFWSNFDFQDNVFVAALEMDFDLTLDKTNPDLLIYSWEGQDFKKYSCLRVYYTPENWLMPKYSECDFSLSFEYWHDSRNLRYPNYLLYKISGSQLTKKEWDFEKIYDLKSGFCSFVVSNAGSQVRNKFFSQLNQLKSVASGGRHLNNVGGPVENKMKFLDQYRFNIAFENALHPGYTTEKIVEAMAAQTIPIYYGHDSIDLEFNKASFFNYADYSNEKELMEDVLNHENSRNLYLEKLSQPWFIQDTPNQYFDDNRLRYFFREVVLRSEKRPIGKRKFVSDVLYPGLQMLRRLKEKLKK